MRIWAWICNLFSVRRPIEAATETTNGTANFSDNTAQEETFFFNPVAAFRILPGNILVLPEGIEDLMEPARKSDQEDHQPYMVLASPAKGGHFRWPIQRRDRGLVIFFPDLSEHHAKLRPGDSILVKVKWVESSTDNRGGCACVEFYAIARLSLVAAGIGGYSHVVSMFFLHCR